MKKYIYLLFPVICLSLQVSAQNYSLIFTGNSLQSVQLPDSNIFYNAQHGFTWECWMYPDTIPVGNDTVSDPYVGQMLFTAEDAAPYDDITLGFGWAYLPENWLAFSVDGQSYVRDNNPPHYVIPQAKVWYHVAGVCNYDSGYTALFVNGQLVSTSYFIRNTPGFTPLSRNIQPDIGNISSQTGQAFQGQIDEVMIWNYPKTPAQVMTDKDTCYTGMETGMVAYYRANEGTGVVAHDATPNHLDGTLQDTTACIAAYGYVTGPGDVSWAPGQPRNTCLNSVSITGSSFCVCSQVNISFHNSNTMNPGNTYVAQLSDSSGNFANPVAIGILQSSASSGIIPSFIPCSATPGTRYRIRIVSDNPVAVGADNGNDLVIKAPDTASVNISANPAGSVCPKATVSFTSHPVNGGSSPAYQWLLNNSLVAANSSTYSNNSWNNGDIVTCIMTSNASCVTGSPDTSNKVNIVITTLNAGTLSTIKDTICSGSLADLTLSGNSVDTIQWQSSGSGNNFSNITGATKTSYHSQPLNQTTYFRVFVRQGLCTDTSASFRILVKAAPVAAFTFNVTGHRVAFNGSTSTGANYYSWNFGDGRDTSVENPVHRYDTSGTFHVCLTVTNNSNCNFTLCQNVTIFSLGITNVGNETWQVYPDPFSDHLYITPGQAGIVIENITMYDLLGRTVFLQNVNSEIDNRKELDISGITQGVYYLAIKTVNGYYVRPVVKQ